MSIQQERLHSLIEFAQHSARLRTRLATDVAQYNIFHAHERDISELPGLHFSGANEDKEAWLIIERLQEFPAPQPASDHLRVWLDLTNDPGKEPELRTHLAAVTLRSIGVTAASKDEAGSDADQLLLFETYEQRSLVEDQSKSYIEQNWKPWSIEEKRRRRTISLYAKLFTLKQQLEGAIVDNPVELIWGAGIAVWNTAGAKLTHPLLSQQVELFLNETTMAIEIRPRDSEPRLELDFFSATNNPGISALDKAAGEFFSNAPAVFSPLDRSSFEPLLRTAVTYLDPAGIFWPDQTTAEDRTLPSAEDQLKVTDTWVLFARPRNASLLIQDLERFKGQIENIESLPKALLSLVTDPSTANRDMTLPAFRGLSMIHGSGDLNAPAAKGAQDLFFPDAFNDEQVQIVQKLQVYDGVVVQGPPGTGKTHTIANIICHYLAMGKRVLVTSMKEPALNVLREKLPDRIQPLAISLLTTERDGMKQFEHAIAKIASEVQSIDRLALARDITQIEANIDSCHARLATTDAQINDWAIKNLSPIDLDGEHIEPRIAAAEVVAGKDSVMRLEDGISIGAEFRPQFTDANIFSLREARRALGPDLDYLGAELPKMSAFPDSRELLCAHQDLSRYADLQMQIDSGSVPPLADSSEATIAAVQRLYEQISNLKELRLSINNASLSWTDIMLMRLRTDRQNEVLSLFDSLADVFDTEIAKRRQFLARPVELSDERDDRNEILLSAIQRSAEGKSPFGITDLLGKNSEKASLKAIRVDGHPPSGSGDWQQVLDYVNHRRSLRTLLTRWNNLADEFGLPPLPVEPAQATALSENLGHYRKLDTIATLESTLAAGIKRVCPSWPQPDMTVNNDGVLNELQTVLFHHLTQNRLAETWAIKERVQQILSGCSGRITIAIRHFIDQTLGDPAIAEADLQAQWSGLMEELRRIQRLNQPLQTVGAVARLIADSGASRWAGRLTNEAVTTATDPLLPDNWRALWRLNRLANHLESIDGRVELKRLTALRAELEAELARSYQDAVANGPG